MKKNILMLINGFGIERGDSYNIYNSELMPNMERIRTEKMFGGIPNKYLDYKSAYRNFSMGIDNPLTYSLVENNINTGEFMDNEMFKYIINQTVVNKSRLHIMCFWESDKTLEQLSQFLNVIKKNNISRIFLHMILCQKSLYDYKDIQRGLNALNYDAGSNVKIGVVTGENNFYSLLPAKDLVKNFITEFGEKWKDLNKKVDVLVQTQTVPCDTRTFSVNPTYRFEDNDQVLVFNYNNIDLSIFRKELYEQKYRQVNMDSVKFYSLFPLKAETQLPFIYNYAVSGSYLLDSLTKANTSCLVFDKKEYCPYINYYLTGLRNSVDDNLKYMPTDDGFIYNKELLLQNLENQKDKDFIIINYDLSKSKTVEELKDNLHKIDEMAGVLDAYTQEHKYGFIITSLYGFQRDMYNEKRELCAINFSGKVPVIISNPNIAKADYTLDTGSLYDICNTSLKFINPDYPEEGILKKKSTLFSFLNKLPMKGKK